MLQVKLLFSKFLIYYTRVIQHLCVKLLHNFTIEKIRAPIVTGLLKAEQVYLRDIDALRANYSAYSSRLHE